MEAIMSFLLVSAALAAVVWIGLKSLSANSQRAALQPIRIEDQETLRRQLREKLRID